MTTWIRSSIAIVSLLAASCASAPPGRPVSEADGPPRRAPLVTREAADPSVHTHPYAVRTAPKVLSLWVPSHVSDGKLVGGHTLDVEVDRARWWTEALSPEERPEPVVSGAMREELKSRPSKALWNSVSGGAFVPLRGSGGDEPPGKPPVAADKP